MEIIVKFSKIFKLRSPFSIQPMTKSKVKEPQENPIFKEGYVFQVKKIDFDSPEVKNMVAETVKEQEVIIERKMIDLDTLNKVYTL